MERAPLTYDTSSIFSKLFILFSLETIKYFRKNTAELENLPEIPSGFHFHRDLESLKLNWNSKFENERPNFLKALAKTVWKEYFSGCFYVGLFISLSYVQIVLIGEIIAFLRDKDTEIYNGYIFLVLLAISLTIGNLAITRGFFFLNILTGKIKCLISILIARKGLRSGFEVLSADNNSSKLVNIVGSDIELFELLVFTVNIWLVPITYGGCALILCFQIGAYGLIPLSITFLFTIFILLLSKLNTKIRMNLSKVSDSRIKMITNLIDGIKTIKLYAWEKPLLKLIKNERAKEVNEFIKMGLLQATTKLIPFIMGGICTFVTLLIYVEDGNTLTLDQGLTVTVTIIFYNTMTNFLVGGIRVFFLIIATCQRITQVLLFKEKNEGEIETRTNNIRMESAFFSWDPLQKSPVLYNLNIDMAMGELLVVVGPVGSGKSSFLLSLLKEIPLLSGYLSCGSSMSYCPESAWIVSASLKQNIVLDKHFDPKLYDLAIKASCLIEDLESMEEGDETLVGDRGVTLSGGQKARICLARAIYSDKAVLLLDDPLSAVDAEVGRQMFENLLDLKSRGKTIILATHQLQTLVRSDKVLVLEEGRQVFVGEYEEMKEIEEVNLILGQINRKTAVEEKRKEKIKQDENINEELNKGKGTIKVIEAETKAQGSVPLHIYYKYFKYGFKNACAMIGICLLLMISQGFLIAVYYWVSVWSEASDQSDTYYYNWFFVIIAGLIVFGAIRFVSVYIGLMISNKKLHNKSLKGLTESSSVYFDKNPTGRILNRFTKDTITADETLVHYYSDFFHMSLLIFGNTLIALIISPATISALVIIVIMFIIINKLIVPVSRDLRRVEIVSKSPVLTSLNSIMSGLATIRASGTQKTFYKQTKHAAIDNFRAFLAYQIVLRYIQMTIEYGTVSLIIINTFFIILFKDSIDSELGAISLSMTVAICGLLNYWMKLSIEVNNYMASPQRLFEYAELKREGNFKTSTPLTITAGKIQFCNFCLRYQPSFPLVLKNLCFTVEAGEKVGIVGRTGAGKSSIIQALFRLVPASSGTILIDGQDIFEAGLRDLRSQMSVIPQTPFIFRASLRENLDPFREFADSQIFDVLDSVRLLDLVTSLSNKLDTQIMSRELNLSAGQKQLLCLARAILRNSKIIHMDEATANVDQETDRLIQQQIKAQFVDRTVLIIAHRLRTIIESDKIIVMDNAKCSEIGSPKELGLREESMFRNLIDNTEPEERDFLLNSISQSTRLAIS